MALKYREIDRFVLQKFKFGESKLPRNRSILWRKHQMSVKSIDFVEKNQNVCQIDRFCDERAITIPVKMKNFCEEKPTKYPWINDRFFEHFKNQPTLLQLDRFYDKQFYKMFVKSIDFTPKYFTKMSVKSIDFEKFLIFGRFL